MIGNNSSLIRRVVGFSLIVFGLLYSIIFFVPFPLNLGELIWPAGLLFLALLLLLYKKKKKNKKTNHV